MTDDRDDHASDSTLGMLAAGGTLDLPVEDQVAPGSSLDPGKLVGRFVIRARLGEGGMGVVLSGMDPDLGRAVAIKVVKESADHPAYRARLLREAQVMARLEHPNVLRVYEVGSDRGRLFLAMELVDGVTLTSWVKVQRRPWREIVAMFEQVGAGLSAVHRAGLVHRDFKPDNVLVDRDGRARVSDFGLARIDPDLRETNTPNLGASLTKTGMLVGTPAYMAPEQYYGSDVDARADQYSFCVALREALSGKRVAKVDDPEWSHVPRAVREVIDLGAAVDLNERFESMEELLEALRSAQGRTARVIGIVAGAAVLAAGAVATVMLLARGEDERPRVVEAPVAIDAAIASPVVMVDAAVAPPADAAVVAAPADARVVVATRDREKRPPVVKAAGSGDTIGGVTITPMVPLAETDAAKKHNIEGGRPLHEMIAAHRPIVRDALEDLGFGGLTFTGSDLDADFAELETKLAAATDDFDRGVIMYAMGQIERRRGSCIAAAKQWKAARPLVATGARDVADTQRHTRAFLYLGRITVAQVFCDMIGGRALGAEARLQNALTSMWGAGDPERAEVLFAQGIARWETGDIDGGERTLEGAIYRGGERMRLRVHRYADAVGIKY